MNRLFFASVALVFVIGAASALSGMEYVQNIQNTPTIKPIIVPSKMLPNNSTQSGPDGENESIWRRSREPVPNTESLEFTDVNGNNTTASGQGGKAGYSGSGADGTDKTTASRKNIVYDQYGRISSYDEEGENKRTTTVKNFKYDEKGRVISYTEEIVDSGSSGMKTVITTSIEYNELGQVEKETTIEKEAGEKCDGNNKSCNARMRAYQSEELDDLQDLNDEFNFSVLEKSGVKGVQFAGNNSSKLEIEYKLPAKIFGFIPLEYDTKVAVAPDGGYAVGKPWWLFLTDNRQQEFESEVKETMDDLSSGSELSMVNLQSLMSQRAQAIQLASRMLEGMENTTKSIIQGIR